MIEFGARSSPVENIVPGSAYVAGIGTTIMTFDPYGGGCRLAG